MPVSLDIASDWEVFDETVSATYAQTLPSGTAGATATVTVLFTSLAEHPAGFQQGLAPAGETCHVEAADLAAASIEPGPGDTVTVASGKYAGTYVVERFSLDSWRTRYVLTVQRLEGNG